MKKNTIFICTIVAFIAIQKVECSMQTSLRTTQLTINFWVSQYRRTIEELNSLQANATVKIAEGIRVYKMSALRTIYNSIEYDIRDMDDVAKTIEEAKGVFTDDCVYRAGIYLSFCAANSEGEIRKCEHDVEDSLFAETTNMIKVYKNKTLDLLSIQRRCSEEHPSDEAALDSNIFEHPIARDIYFYEAPQLLGCITSNIHNIVVVPNYNISSLLTDVDIKDGVKKGKLCMQQVLDRFRETKKRAWVDTNTCLLKKFNDPNIIKKLPARYIDTNSYFLITEHRNFYEKLPRYFDWPDDIQ